MGSLSGTLRRLFSSAPAKPQPILLPSAVLQAIADGNLSTIQQYVQQLVQTNPQAPEFDLIIAEARRLGWPSPAINKLEVFGHYYKGNLKQAFEGAAPYTVAAAFDPDLFIIATCSLYHLNQFQDAYRMLSGTVGREALFAQRADFHIVAALICRSTNHLDEMRQAIDAARRIEPDNAVAAFNAYAMYFELGDMEAFDAVRQQILTGMYQSNEAGFALAIVELAQDHYPEGFRLMEMRYDLSQADRYLNALLFDRPRWQGEELTGKTLLVSAEQGIGDTLMLARYFFEVAHRVGQLVIETQPETLSLLSHNFPGIAFLPRDYTRLPSAHFDVWTGSMSLPFVFGATSQNIPGKSSYLKAPPESLAYWRGRVEKLARPGHRLRVGLTWSGNPNHRADLRRSIPWPSIALAIQDLDAEFFSLQTAVPDDYPGNFIDVSEELITLADTAALVECMDLVITVDTASVHLAGALGKETWLLLPYRYEWRWGLEGEGNNWYDSVSVIRQTKGGDWMPVIEEAFSRRLQQRINSIGRS